MKYAKIEEKLISSLKLDGESEEKYVVKSSVDEDKAIEFVKFNQAMEGFEVTPEDEEDMRKIWRGEITIDEAINQVLDKHGLSKYKKQVSNKLEKGPNK